MPPKRKAAKKSRSQSAAAAAAVVVEDETQTAQETFDVAYADTDQDGSVALSVQRQQELRSPAGSQRGPAVGGGRKAKKGAKKNTPAQDNANEEVHDGPARMEAIPADEGHGDDDDASLAQRVLGELVAGSATPAARSVMDVYLHRDREVALCGILNVIAKASGVEEVQLDKEALGEGIDISPLLEELYARVTTDPGGAAYLLASKERQHRGFRKGLREFAEQLLQMAYTEGVLTDNVLLPTIAQWVISMSNSKVRSFRHTATVYLLGTIESLNKLHAVTKESLLESHDRKETKAREEMLEWVAHWRDHFFSLAIHQRLRDVAPQIRLAVFERLRLWVVDYREEFMTNKYLRYFGMPLHDKDPELRAEALDMIWQALTTVPDAYSRMNSFLRYFANRLVEMSNDVDVRRAELAIRIVAMMVRGDSEAVEGSELLTNVMIDRVLLNLFDERPTIRTAAGILLKVFIHCRTVDEETEEEQLKVATELLCSFASTLRAQYEERMPEKYLIDALWMPEQLPLLLTEYGPMLETAQSAETPAEAVIGLGLLTAVLNKAQGRLTLGPLPKDDRRGTIAANKKPSATAQAAADDLARRITEDLGGALCGILENHRGDESVLCAAAHAVAALDLQVFASGRPAQQLEGILQELRKATLSARCSETIRTALAAAWYAVAMTDHPLKSSAQAHLQFMAKEVLKLIEKAAEDATEAAPAATSSAQKLSRAAQHKAAVDAANMWGRVSLVSSLVSLSDQWPVIRDAFARQLNVVSNSPGDTAGSVSPSRAAGSSREVGEEEDAAVARKLGTLERLAETSVNCVLWAIGAHPPPPLPEGEEAQVVATAHAAVPWQDKLAEVVALLLRSLSAGDGLLRDGATTEHAASVEAIVSLRSCVVLHLCDLCALSYYDMTLDEQEMLVDAFDSLFEYWSSQLRVAQDVLKATVSQRTEDATLSQVATARQQTSHMEAAQMRLTLGVSRLLVLQRMDASLAPRVLVQWTQTTSKAVADTIKSLFHTLRNRAGDGFQLERDVLLTAYARCAEVGATPVSVEALYQTGSKLASVHLPSTDRFYSAVVAVVRFATQFATSTDPLLLQGVAPYCGKLRTGDALQILRQELASQEMFMNATNPYARAFVAAMRKAAKLQDYFQQSGAMEASAAGATAARASGAGVKRQRELAYGGAPVEERDDTLLAAMEESVAADDQTSTLHQHDAHRSSGHGAKQHAKRGGGEAAVGRMSVAARVITEDGWRDFTVPASQDAPNVEVGAPNAARQPRARAAVALPTSQEMAMSTAADDIDTEAFISTVDFE